MHRITRLTNAFSKKLENPMIIGVGKSGMKGI